MAEKTFNTRILLKYDTYSNWTSKNPILKAGEVAIATIASGNTQEVNSITAPQVLIKVGDGTSNYTALPFVSGKAADVHSWAKAASKPTYAATEITGIGDYIATYVDETLGISVDTDTQYRITMVDDYEWVLQSQAKGTTTWKNVSTIDIPRYDDTTVKADITTLKNLVGTTAVATQITNAINALNLANNYAAKSHTHAISEVTGLENRLSAVERYAADNDNAIDNLSDDVADYKTTVSSTYETKSDATAKLNEAKTYTNTGVAEAKSYTDTKIAALLDGADDTTLDSIKELADAIKTNDSAIDALNEVAGTKASASDLNALKTRVTTAEGEIDTLQSASHTHSNKAVLDGITSEKVSAWDSAQTNAINYASGAISSAIGTLQAVAKTGNVNDLTQTSGDVLVFNCGNASTVF